MKTYILIITEINGERTARTTVIQNGTITNETFEYELIEGEFTVPQELDDWQTEFVGNRPTDR